MDLAIDKRSISVLARFFPDTYSPELIDKLTSISTRIEEGILGRYCGSLGDRLVQMLAVYDSSVKSATEIDGVHVDIGVLFGGSILAKLEVLKLAGKRQKIIGIDPFDGFYGKKVEPVTELPVIESNVWENLQRFEHSGANVDLVSLRSQDPQTLEHLEGLRVLTLMIDGDHSYEGVKADWDIYSKYVAPGGYVIFDDYRMMFHFFTVTRFIMDLLHTRPDGWRVVGAYDTTFLLQRMHDNDEFRIDGGF